jgi:energy-coupling factor transporter ATP-binding protein EcfA2
MNQAERGLHDLLTERLDADPTVDEPLARTVLAAWDGDDALAAAVAGHEAVTTVTPTPGREPAPDVFLAAIHAEGFRGVGPAATLPLRPGPGLTLITGRNGSGKSSFAEAAELALTGDSRRWSGRTVVWRKGWRNLHAPAKAFIGVDLVTAGASGVTRIARRWADGDELDGGRWTRQRSGGEREQFDGEAWREDMVTYRPFLSYSELGALIDGKPTELHDAMHNLLGLGPLTAAKDRLRLARKKLTDAAKAVSDARKELRADLAHVDDPRAVQATALLASARPDLPAVAKLVAGASDDPSGGAALIALAALEAPDAAKVHASTARLRRAADRAGELATAETRSADRIAKLLRLVLDDHDGLDTSPCPVCGTGTLDDGWRAGAVRRATEMEEAAAALRDASAELTAAVAAGRALTAHRPPVLGGSVPIDIEALARAWSDWQDAGRAAGAAELAHALDTALGPLAAAVEDIRARARAELAHRDEVWAPLARRLGAWHDAAAATAAAKPTLDLLGRALQWLTDTSDSLRDERLAPFADASHRVWQTLRQQSNVDLGPVRLGGTGTRRHVALDVRIDGTDGGAALGVMSQGELHALGLSLFLPRATVEQSPFRFVLIDDPVQAMDPAKVDGLAQVLAEVAVDRQVVVFTHDDRLADAVRRLEIPATVWEVQRGERSVVELRHSEDPVSRYLDDARAMALTKNLPSDLRGELVATCCRSAVEAAAHAKIRRVRLGRGERHADVEKLISEAKSTSDKVTLAVLDDPAKRPELLRTVRKEQGTPAVDALQRCRQGAHHGLDGDLRPFVKDVERLAEWIQR